MATIPYEGAADPNVGGENFDYGSVPSVAPTAAQIQYAADQAALASHPNSPVIRAANPALGGEGFGVSPPVTFVTLYPGNDVYPSSDLYPGAIAA